MSDSDWVDYETGPPVTANDADQWEDYEEFAMRTVAPTVRNVTPRTQPLTSVELLLG